MTTLAYLMMDGSVHPKYVLIVCVYCPSIAISLSWLLMRIKRWLVVPALFAALLSALFVFANSDLPRAHQITVEDYGLTYVVAIYTAAALPLVATIAFYLEARFRNSNAKTDKSS